VTRRETATSHKGRSFHFKVTHVTRGKGRSGGKAAAHEAQIERESAVEKGAAQQAYLEDAGKLELSALGTIGSTLRERQQFCLLPVS